MFNGAGKFRSIFYFAKIFWRCVTISNNELMINEQIRDKEVRVIDSNGAQLGIMSIDAANELADKAAMDLVKISPTANPPVCKIMDYGKFRFEQSKKEKETRKNQKIVELKEVRLSATIDTHDLEVKAKHCLRFLSDGDKVKVSIRFRGRQATHSEIGLNVMKVFYGMVQDKAAVDKQPKLEGRNMTMFLSPKA